MSYRAMALVAASLLFATQCYAAKTINNSKSNSYKQPTINNTKSNTYKLTTRPGGTKGTSGPAANARFGWDIGANKEAIIRSNKGGGGTGKPAESKNLNSSRSNIY
jgi:hypothetical protein